MLYTVFAVVVLISVLLLGFYLMIYMISLVHSTLMGSPYVKTRNKSLREALDFAGLKKGDLLVDLGCGEGSVVFTAAEHYHAKAIGVDINPLLMARAKLTTKLKKLKNVTFKRENIYQTDISKADVIYMFLLPKFLMKLKSKLTKESKKGAVIISHGFLIEGWEQYLVKKLKQSPFSTYIYKIS